MYFRVNFEVHSGYGGPFRSVLVRSGPFGLVNAPHVLLSVGLWSTAFVTFSVSWELCNIVLLVVQVLSFGGQEIKTSVHQLHNGQP